MTRLERMQRLIDAYILDEITREDFVRRTADLNGDWHDAMAMARLLENNAKSWDAIVRERDELRAEREHAVAVQRNASVALDAARDEIEQLRAENVKLVIANGEVAMMFCDAEELRIEIERLQAALVSIGILNASASHPDSEIDRVIREMLPRETKPGNEERANANLIAAAPDMLAALKMSEEFHNPNARAATIAHRKKRSMTDIELGQIIAELRIAGERMEIQAGVMKQWSERFYAFADTLANSKREPPPRPDPSLPFKKM